MKRNDKFHHPNQGKTRWMIIDESFNSDKLIEFLQALILDAGKKVFLILDNLRVHHSKPVKAWVEAHKDKIELEKLPTCKNNRIDELLPLRPRHQ